MHHVIWRSALLVLSIALGSGLAITGNVEADDDDFGMAEVISAQGDTIPVYVDIIPGSCPSIINTRMVERLLIAVLGSAEFDVNSIDRHSARLTREGIDARVQPPGWTLPVDVATPFTGDLCGCHSAGADGFDDLIFQFWRWSVVTTLELSGLDGQELRFTLTANLVSDTPGLATEVIIGSDCAIIHDRPWATEKYIGR